MKNLAAVILLLVGSFIFVLSAAEATVQIQDKIIYKDKTYYIDQYPIQQYIESYSGVLADKLLLLRSGATTSSNWKGYDAKWEIRSGKLWLVSIFINSPLVQVTDLFPSRQLPFWADWYTGLLIINIGGINGYVSPMVPGASRVIELKIEGGVVISEEEKTRKVESFY